MRKFIINMIELIIILMILMIPAYFFEFATNQKHKDRFLVNKNYCIESKSSLVKGIVDTCYSDNKNRGTDVLYLICEGEKVKINVFDYPDIFFKVIEKGDSIYKNSNTFDIYVFKTNQDTVIFCNSHNFDCNHWDNPKSRVWNK